MPDSSNKLEPQHNSPQPGTQSGSQIIERKLATILSADVAEFSRLMNEDEEQTLRTFRGHKKIFEALVLTHHGRVFNTAGDAILAEFASAVEAVRCATDVQSALRTRNDQLPPSRQVRFRIGVNLGDVMVQGQDLLGDGINIAARLQTAAEPSGICISGSVYDQIRNKLSLSFHSLGERTYKNIPQPVRTFSIVEAESGAPLPSPSPSRAWKNPTIWLAAGLLIVAGVAYAAYATYHRGTNQTASKVAGTVRQATVSAPLAAVSPVPDSNREKPAVTQPEPSRKTARPAPRKATTDGTTSSSDLSTGHPKPSPNFGGTWELVSNTMNGVSQTIKPTRITITQSGTLVRVVGQELRLTNEGTVTYQTFSAHDEKYGHQVETRDQADLIDTFTWRIEGSMLVFETVFDYARPYYGHPVGKLVRIMEYRRVIP